MNAEKEPMLQKEADFDAYLHDAVPDLVADDISSAVNPWKQALSEILIGTALSFFTLRFLFLDLILPALGFGLALRGWFRLREQNKAFRAGWILMLARTAVFLFMLFMDMSIYSVADWLGGHGDTAVGILTGLLLLAQLFCLRKGLDEVMHEACQESSWQAVSWLILCYLLILLASFIRLNGLLALAVIVPFVLCLVRVGKLSEKMDPAGYVIAPKVSRITADGVTKCYVAALILCFAIPFLFLNRFPMDWKKQPEVRSEEALEIKKQLTYMGFPKERLEDLPEEELLACRTAESVMVSSHSWNDVSVDSVAVVLSEQPRVWKVFYFFSLSEDAWHGGTEALEIDPDRQFDAGIVLAEDPHGAVLYRKGEDSFSAPITRIRKEQYTSVPLNGIGTAGTTQISWFAEFSWPRKGEDMRGWVSLTVEDPYKMVVFEWENAEYEICRYYSGGLAFIHQTGRLQYPVRSARTARTGGGSYFPEIPFRTMNVSGYFFPRPQTIADPSDTEN